MFLDANYLLLEIDKNMNGFGPGEGKSFQYRSPSLKQYEATLVSMQREKEEAEAKMKKHRPKSEEWIKAKNQHRSAQKLYDATQKASNEGQHVLGNALMGSGLAYRHSNNARMDYALIYVNHTRLMSNEVREKS